MKFAFLLYGDSKVWENATPEERAEIYAAHGRFFETLTARNAFVAGQELALPEEAMTVRESDGLAVAGPFTEVAEHLGGFYVVEARDMDDAVALARMLPGNVEIRPVVEQEGGMS